MHPVWDEHLFYSFYTSRAVVFLIFIRFVTDVDCPTPSAAVKDAARLYAIDLAGTS